MYLNDRIKPGMFIHLNLFDEPEKLDINKLSADDILKHPAVVEALARARTQEKDKLYPTISRLESQLEALNKDKEERDKAIQKAREDADAEARKNMSLEQRFETSLTDMQNKFTQLQSSAQSQIGELTQQLQAERLENRRLALIAQHGVPEEFTKFVRGTTVEELEASIKDVVEVANKFKPQSVPPTTTTTAKPGANADQKFPPTAGGIQEATTNSTQPTTSTAGELGTTIETAEKVLNSGSVKAHVENQETLLQAASEAHRQLSQLQA